MGLTLWSLLCSGDFNPAAITIQFSNQPSSSVALESILDSYQQKMLALGEPLNVYAQEDADQFLADGVQHIWDTMGLNFSLSNPDLLYDPALDLRYLGSVAVMVPIYLDGDYYQKIHGADFTPRNSEEWTARSCNLLVLFQEDVTITSGAVAGQEYKAGDLFSYSYIDHFYDGGNWNELHYRDHFVLCCMGHFTESQ